MANEFNCILARVGDRGFVTESFSAEDLREIAKQQPHFFYDEEQQALLARMDLDNLKEVSLRPFPANVNAVSLEKFNGE